VHGYFGLIVVLVSLGVLLYLVQLMPIPEVAKFAIQSVGIAIGLFCILWSSGVPL
jgi:hypothetical protein